MSLSSLRQKITQKIPVIMGIVNVTPDSFSEKGSHFKADDAIAAAHQMIKDGADILDIGGESTRPGADPVTVNEELRRVLPVIDGLKDCGVPVSIDTYNAETMAKACDHGASIINDVTALTGDSQALEAASQTRAMICLMHMQGKPKTMQANPQYDDVVCDVKEYLKTRIQACEDAGIEKERLMIDPGIGFGKTLDHNRTIFNRLDEFQELDVPLLLGVSRKSFIEKICPNTPADKRLPGSLAACLWGWQTGVQIFRVHDVADTKQAFDVWQAISKI